MKKLVDLLQMNFLPRSVDAGLLVLRLWFGLSLVILHGWSKLMMLTHPPIKFADPIGIGVVPSLVLTVFAEFVCSLLLALGLFTRFAAAVLTIQMGVAFFLVHKLALSGEHSGELAYVYLAAYVTLLISGGGLFSLDAKINGAVRNTY